MAHMLLLLVLALALSASAFNLHTPNAKLSNKVAAALLSIGLGAGLGVSPSFAGEGLLTGTVTITEGVSSLDSNAALYITAKEDLDVFKSGVLNIKPPPLLTQRIQGPVTFPLSFSLQMSDATPEGAASVDSWYKKGKGGPKNLLVAVRLDTDGVAATRDATDLVGKDVAVGEAGAAGANSNQWKPVQVLLTDRGIGGKFVTRKQ